MQRYVAIAVEELSTGEFASAMHQSIVPIEPISVIICGTRNSVFFKVSLFQLLLKLLDRYITMPNANFNECPREGPSQPVRNLRRAKLPVRNLRRAKLPVVGTYDGPTCPSYEPTTGQPARRRNLRRAYLPVVGTYDGPTCPS